MSSKREFLQIVERQNFLKAVEAIYKNDGDPFLYKNAEISVKKEEGDGRGEGGVKLKRSR